ncbi:MAG TPA: HAD family hydrolase [Polyangia bacterium]|nr:HAD family hydrolase [Polyangia bacterium]
MRKLSLVSAVLFDVGGPLDCELRWEQLIDRDIRAALATYGVQVSDADYERANAAAVHSFAPSTYRTIIWQLAAPLADRAAVAAAVYARVAAGGDARDDERGGIELRPGVDALLRRLTRRGLPLAILANQPHKVRAELRRVGIEHHFAHVELPGDDGIRKPDPRFFLRACAALGVAPEHAIMVGDRIDNDIAPARSLGMRAVRLRTGRHIAQEARDVNEVPDADVHDLDALAGAIFTLADELR